MSTTTMQPVLAADLSGEQPISEHAAGAVHQAWWALLGLLAVSGEQTGRLLGVLVRRGKEFEPAMYEGFKKAGKGIRGVVGATGTQLKEVGKAGKGISDAVGAVGTQLKGVGQKIGKASGKVESIVDERVSAALERMGIPTKDEIQSLSRKVDELTSKIEELRAGADKPTGRRRVAK